MNSETNDKANGENKLDSDSSVNSEDNPKTLAKNEDYEVEQIMDMEIKPRLKCPVKFRVRWVGFSEKEDTWVALDDLQCQDLVDEFLEISGRKGEFERALEAKKKENETVRELRSPQSIPNYSELDEDEEEILPSGTRSRRIRRKIDSVEGLPSANGETPSKRRPTTSNATKPKSNFEVDYIIETRINNSKNEYLIHWKGFSNKDDSWEPEDNLQHCPGILSTFTEQQIDNKMVEAIGGMRLKNGKEEFKVKWKGLPSKRDSWLTEEQLAGSRIFQKFKDTLNRLENQQYWQVEKILTSKEENGQIKYLIHWRGFDSEDDTWEPEENLTQCPELLAKFKAKNKKKKRGSSVSQTEDDSSEDIPSKDTPKGARSRRKSSNSISYSQFYD